MAIKCIKRLTITCDNCKKTIATGQTATEVVSSFEENEKYTEIYCTDCIKLPPQEVIS
jgi:RNase P subunit RPR2